MAMINIGKNPPTRVLIADDRPEVRSALRFLLENEDGNWHIIGEAADIAGLQEAIQNDRADLVLLDWELPCHYNQGSGSVWKSAPELVTGLREKCMSLLIIAISGFSEARQQAQAAGVDGFVSKSDPPEMFLSVLKRVEARL